LPSAAFGSATLRPAVPAIRSALGVAAGRATGTGSAAVNIGRTAAAGDGSASGEAEETIGASGTFAVGESVLATTGIAAPGRVANVITPGTRGPSRITLVTPTATPQTNSTSDLRMSCPIGARRGTGQIRACPTRKRALTCPVDAAKARAATRILRQMIRVTAVNDALPWRQMWTNDERPLRPPWPKRCMAADVILLSSRQMSKVRDAKATFVT
jgi:hypothetical protein